MPRKCSVFNCSSNYRNYDNRHSEKSKVTVYKFPSDPAERQKWIDAIPNKLNLKEVSDWMGVCANHWYADAPLRKKSRFPSPAIAPNKWPNCKEEDRDPSAPKQSLQDVLPSHWELYPHKKTNTKTKGKEVTPEPEPDEPEEMDDFTKKDMFENAEEELGKTFKDCFVEKICFHGVVGMVSFSQFTLHSRARVGMVHSFTIYFKFREIDKECTVKSVQFEGYFGNQQTPHHKFTDGIIRRWSELAEVVRFYTLDYKLEGDSADNNDATTDAETGTQPSESSGEVITLESSILDDKKVTKLVGEYLHLCQRIQCSKDLSKIDLELLSMSVDVERFPAVKVELDKVQRLVQSVINGRETMSLRVVDQEDSDFDFAFGTKRRTGQQHNTRHNSSIHCHQKSGVKEMTSSDQTKEEAKGDVGDNNNNNEQDDELTEIDSAEQALDDVPSPIVQPSRSLEEESERLRELEKEVTISMMKSNKLAQKCAAPVSKKKMKGDKKKKKKKKMMIKMKKKKKAVLNFHLNPTIVKTESNKTSSQQPELPRLNIIGTNDSEPSTCQVCGNTYKHKRSLDEHMQIHQDIMFPCEVCGKEFKKQRYLKLHLRIHNPGPRISRPNNVLSEPSLCSICGRKFRLKTTFRAHMKHHEEFAKNGLLKCALCGKQFQFKRYLRIHMRRHAPTEAPSTCEICGKTFRLKETLRSHKYHVHGNHSVAAKQPPMSPSPCPICGKIIGNRRSMKKHIDSHKGAQRFECSICFKKFTAKGSLKAHEILHTGNFPHRCSYCNKGFTARNSLQRHEKAHLDRPYSCYKCGKLFKSDESAKSHAAKCKMSGRQVENSSSGNNNNSSNNATLMNNNNNNNNNNIYEVPVTTTATITSTYAPAPPPPLPSLPQPPPPPPSSSVETVSINLNDRTPQIYDCPLCQHQCPHRTSLAFHLLSTHSRELDRCLLCNVDETFSTTEDFEMHMKTVHLSDVIMERQQHQPYEYKYSPHELSFYALTNRLNHSVVSHSPQNLAWNRGGYNLAAPSSSDRTATAATALHRTEDAMPWN